MKLSRTIIETSDLDAYPALEREEGWDSEKAQLSKGSAYYRFALITVGDISVWRYHASSRLYHDFTTLSETVDLVFFRDSEGIVWCGHELPKSTALIHRANESYWATTPPDRMIYGVYFPRTSARKWDLLPFDFIAASPSAANSVLVGGEREIASFLDRIDALIDSKAGAFPSTEEAVDIRERLLSDLSACLSVSLKATDVTPKARELPRSSLINDARDLINSQIEKPITAGELAEQLFVSRRVLELAFRDAFGMGPYHFILNLKLHAIRRALLRQEGSVREISDRYGFVNAGRLAGMYARLFGELPSTTIRGETGAE